MIALLQRVDKSSLYIENNLESSIKRGILVLLGIAKGDKIDDVRWLVNKVINVRIFDKEDQKQVSVKDINGHIMVVSQFTLHGSLNKGNVPSFSKAADRDEAIIIYNKFVDVLKEEMGDRVSTGVFGANMKINLVNDGPFTILINTKNN